MQQEATKESESKEKKVIKVIDHIVEVVSDSGEGAQKASQTFAAVSAKMDNGIWTVEIIPAEIQPPARSIFGASGNRMRLGSQPVTNAGDQADIVIAFNEQVLLSRTRTDNLKKGAIVLLEDKWRTDEDPEICKAYVEVYDQLLADGYKVYEIPMEKECLKYVANPRRGKNMFALGVLANVHTRDMDKMRAHVAFIFRKKDQKIIDSNITLLNAGYEWAEANLDFRFEIPPYKIDKAQLVSDGNTAVALGIMAAGIDICAMYPITPATSVSHYLSEAIEKLGGIVHQSEDEIAACGFAIGASYAGKCAVTVTSGPGMALKTEFIGMAAMGEIPLVIVNVQRGGPSTGLPTKVEQSDLLAAIFGTPGDAPKVVMASATIEDCFYDVITARKIAETFRMPVIVLTDANLATGQQPYPRPEFKNEWLAPPFDQSPVPPGKKPYDRDPVTGLAQRIIPGQPGGMYALTGLEHDDNSRVAYAPEIHHNNSRMRSLKLAAFQKTLKAPTVSGDPEGDLLIISWGSTKGAVAEAVERLQKEGAKVSHLHLRYLQPMASGIKDILKKFKHSLTIEINYSDSLDEELIDEENRRYTNLGWLLRAKYLVDVDCWSRVYGQPLQPREIEVAIRNKLEKIKNGTSA